MNKKEILKELKFSAVRSSGAGGQHVNKVSTKVILNFDVLQSKALLKEEKDRLKKKLSQKINNKGILIITCQESSSQYKNKIIVVDKFMNIIQKALIIPKKRKPTKPSKQSKEKRLKSKAILSKKKKNRSKHIDTD